jgi:hypothetical protein
MDFITTLTNALPEITLGKMMSEIRQFFKIPGGFMFQLNLCQKAIYCMSTVCGYDVAAMQQQVNSLREQLFLPPGDLNFNVDAFLLDCGITDSTNRLVSVLSTDTIDAVQNNIASSVSEGIDVVSKLI